jgi:hypothetical protein
MGHTSEPSPAEATPPADSGDDVLPPSTGDVGAVPLSSP